MSRKILYILTIVVSLLVGSLFPQISAPLRWLVDSSTGVKTPAPTDAAAGHGREGHIELTAEQIAAARIDTASVGPGVLTRRLVVPALVTPDPNRVGRVAAKLAGTVAELRKRLGDHVEKGEVVAVIDSREVADAKSDYLASLVQLNLQQAIFQREKGLFEKQIIAEQMFLRIKTSFAEARLKSDVARQKLASLDLSEAEIAELPKQPAAALRRKDIHAPIAGRVIERLVSLGQPIGGEGQAKELYVLSDLSVVEADLAVPVADLPAVREKQSVSLAAQEGRNVEGVVVFVNAMLTPETRTGHAIASFANRDFLLRPGSLLNATIALAQNRVAVMVPRAALQTINNETTAFVRTQAGFIKRRVEIGAGDNEFVEVVSGLAPGETIAVSNTFVLKAESGKSDIPEE